MDVFVSSIELYYSRFVRFNLSKGEGRVAKRRTSSTNLEQSKKNAGENARASSDASTVETLPIGQKIEVERPANEWRSMTGSSRRPTRAGRPE